MKVGSVRAKLRCMSVTRTWDNSTNIELQPVTQKGKNSENEKFWKATPSGTAEIRFNGPSVDSRGEEYQPGDYYYVDLVKSSEGGWTLTTVTKHGSGHGSVELNTNGKTTIKHYKDLGFSYSKMQMAIDNPSAFEAFDVPGEAWDVQITWAEASDG